MLRKTGFMGLSRLRSQLLSPGGPTYQSSYAVRNSLFGRQAAVRVQLQAGRRAKAGRRVVTDEVEGARVAFLKPLWSTSFH